MSRPLHVAGFCLSVARAADVISQPIADLNGVRIDVSFLQRRGVQIHIGAASIILNEAEAARSIPHLQSSCRHYFPFDFSLISTSRRRSPDFFRNGANTILSFRARLSIADTLRLSRCAIAAGLSPDAASARSCSSCSGVQGGLAS